MHQKSLSNSFLLQQGLKLTIITVIDSGRSVESLCFIIKLCQQNFSKNYT